MHLNSFLRYFFEGQEDIRCTGFFDGNSPLATVDNPLGRSVTTAFLAFAYKETGIVFPGGYYDFTKDFLYQSNSLGNDTHGTTVTSS